MTSDIAVRFKAKYPGLDNAGAWFIRWRVAIIIISAVALGWLNGRELRIGDAVQFASAGDRLLHGHLGIFSEPSLQAGPVHVLHLGLMRILARAVHMQEDLFASIFIHVMFALLAVAVVRSFRKLDGLGVSGSLEYYAATLALVGGVADVANINGHSEEALIPILWLFAGIMMRRKRVWLAGALIGVAAGMKLWGAIGIAVLLIAPSVDTFVRASLAFGLTTAAIYGPFFAFTRVETFHYYWQVEGHTLFAKLGMKSLGFGWPLRLMQAALATAVGGGVAYMFRRNRHVIWATTLAAISVRLMFDPVDLDYYWIGVAITAIAGAAMIASRVDVFWRVPAAGAAYLALYPAYLDGGPFSAVWSLLFAIGVPIASSKLETPAAST